MRFLRRAHLSKGPRVLYADGLSLLVGEADYNIAYLHYLRGEYARALELYRAARAHCERLGDPYHQALCDLDQSELYLELNLIQEGAELADRARVGFEKSGMAFETGKALATWPPLQVARGGSQMRSPCSRRPGSVSDASAVQSGWR